MFADRCVVEPWVAAGLWWSPGPGRGRPALMRFRLELFPSECSALTWRGLRAPTEARESGAACPNGDKDPEGVAAQLAFTLAPGAARGTWEEPSGWLCGFEGWCPTWPT